VETGPVVHGGAHERWQDLPAMRAPDQPDRLQPRAAELLPRLPALRRQTPRGFPPFGSGSLPRRPAGPSVSRPVNPRLLRWVAGAGQVAPQSPRPTPG